MNHSVLQAVIKLASSESSAQCFKQGVYLSIETAKSSVIEWFPYLTIAESSWIEHRFFRCWKLFGFSICVSRFPRLASVSPTSFLKSWGWNNQVLLVDFEIDLLVPKARTPNRQLLQFSTLRVLNGLHVYDQSSTTLNSTHWLNGGPLTMSFPSFVNICGSKARIFTWTKWNHWLSRVERCSKYLYTYIYRDVYHICRLYSIAIHIIYIHHVCIYHYHYYRSAFYCKYENIQHVSNSHQLPVHQRTVHNININIKNHVPAWSSWVLFSHPSLAHV